MLTAEPTILAVSLRPGANPDPAGEDGNPTQDGPQLADSHSSEPSPEQSEDTRQPPSDPSRQSEPQDEQSVPQVTLHTRGIIAIRELDKLEGVEASDQDDDP